MIWIALFDKTSGETLSRCQLFSRQLFTEKVVRIGREKFSKSSLLSKTKWKREFCRKIKVSMLNKSDLNDRLKRKGKLFWVTRYSLGKSLSKELFIEHELSNDGNRHRLIEIRQNERTESEHRRWLIFIGLLLNPLLGWSQLDLSDRSRKMNRFDLVKVFWLWAFCSRENVGRRMKRSKGFLIRSVRWDICSFFVRSMFSFRSRLDRIDDRSNGIDFDLLLCERSNDSLAVLSLDPTNEIQGLSSWQRAVRSKIHQDFVRCFYCLSMVSTE